MSFKTYLNPETIGNKTIDKRHLNIEDMMVSTTSPGMMSAEDKRNLDNFTVKTIIWDNVTNLSNMNDFVNVGVYDIKGERTRSDDNLPILNTGGGNTFNARLTVLDSSISGTGKDDDKCINQMITFNNRLGQGEVYIRTGKGKTLDNLTWDNWSTLQRNVNVVQVNSLDDLVDNGIYSGVLTPTGETFVLVVINNYAIANQYSIPKSISQFKYSVDVYGNVSFGRRVKVGDSSFPDGWEMINDSEINEMMNGYVEYLIEYVDSKFIECGYTPEIVGTSGSVTIYPNKYYKFDNVSNLTVNFNPGQNGVLNNYMFEVTFSGGNTLTLNLQDGIRWANGIEPIYVEGNTYQISIINNLGVFTEFLLK